MCHALVTDPDYLKAATAKMRRSRPRFDFLGLCLLAMTMVCWEIALSKGQEWDWFGDPFYRVQTLATLFVLGLSGLIWRELKFSNPIVNFRTLKDRNFRACCIIIFVAFGILYANTTSLPGMLQSLFGYNAYLSGLVLSPAGLFAIITLLIVGKLLGMGTDARYLIAAGLLTLAIGNYWMSQLNLQIGPWSVVWPRVVLICGLSMLFAPLNVAAFFRIPRELRPAAVGLLALLRNEGGSVGTTVAQTILERRQQFHTLRLNENLDVLNPAVQQLFRAGHAFFLQQTGDAAMTQQLTLQALQQARDNQALSLAYFDVFWVSAVAAAVLVFLVLLMRRSVAEKGAHMAAE